MKTARVRLTLLDGTERFIKATLGKETRLDDRALALFHATIRGERLRTSALDRELRWLHETGEVVEPDGRNLFKSTKHFIEVLREIETQFKEGTRRGLGGF